MTIGDNGFVLVFNHFVEVEILEVVDNTNVVDEFAVLAEEAVSTSPVLRKVFLDEWQSAFSGLLICYGSLLEGDFGGD